MTNLCETLVFFVLLTAGDCFFTNIYGKLKQEPVLDDPGAPVFLTPLIEAGKIKEAQAAANTTYPGFKHVKSYSGYLTVDKSHESNMFFWYFPSSASQDKSPVVLWLQGGPGATSMIGLFLENGPFSPMRRHGLKTRKYSWTNNHHMLYIDNPVGTGYSMTKDGYSTSETDVGKNLYEALVQFFQLFPELQKNDFYVAGESYGGKYVPSIGYTIHQNNPTAKLKINLQGISIGNGLCDPEHQLKYGDYLYQLGLIDGNMQKTIKDIEAEGVKLIQNKQWVEAFKLFDNLLNGDLNNQTSLFTNVTGFANYFNYLVSNDTHDTMQYMSSYIQRADIRRAIHVGNSTFHGESKEVEANLMLDVMQSVAPLITELLSHYPVLIYNGQLDIIVAYPLTVNFLNNLKFSGADEYKTAKRYIWRVGGNVAGYVKHAGNLTEALVRNAGHMVPTDQPQWAFDLITRFTYKKPWN